MPYATTYRRTIACLATALAMIYTSLSCCPADEPPARGPVIQVAPAHPAPTIDGNLDDPCWAEANKLEGFYCPEWDAPAPEETIAYLCADEKAIYIAVLCRDRSPEDIVARETRRNGDLSNEDYLRVAIDRAHQHGDSYVFDVNSCGAQKDYAPGGSAAKIEWRGDWSAAAARTPEGWQAEVAIPFSILRYPPEQKCFGLSITRVFGRERVHAAWPNMGKTEDPTLAADLTGLTLPKPRHRPLFMPYLTADSGDGYEQGLDAGLDVQYKLPNGLTALGAFNPDFKQIEDVVEPISFSYTERYLADPRPFFVTGQQGFLPKEHLLYTRRLQDFDAGLKLFGTVGDETIGLLDAAAFGQENSLAGAWNHRFDDRDNARLLLVSHQQLAVPDNLALGFDACRTWHHPNGADGLWTVLYQTQTEGAGSGSSSAIGGWHDRGLGAISYDWTLRRVTPDFNPALGYYPDLDHIGGSFNMQKTVLYEQGPIFGRQWILNLDYYPRLEGEGFLLSSISPTYALLTRGGRLYAVQVARAQQYGFDSSYAGFVHAWNDADTYRRGEITLVQGQAAGGDLTYYRLNQGLRPTAGLSLRLGGEYTDLAFPDGTSATNYQTVVTASYDLTTEKSVAARAIWRDRGFSAYAAYRQVVRKGMDAYLVVGDPDPSETGITNRFLLKLIWAFS